jgi:hypothetical protein
MALTWRKPPPSPLYYTMCLSTRPTSKWHFVPGLSSGSPKIAKVGTPMTLGLHNFACRPPIKMRSTAKLYPLLRGFQRYVACHLKARELGQFPTFSGREIKLSIWFSSFLLAINLCFICPNGSCEPILDIYVPRAFQWYKKLLKPLSFDPYNRLLKIRESIGTPSPKVGVTLGVWRFIPSHFPTLLGTCDVTLGLSLNPQPCKPLCLDCEPKVKVMIIFFLGLPNFKMTSATLNTSFHIDLKRFIGDWTCIIEKL